MGSIPGLGTSTCHGCSERKGKERKEEKKEKEKEKEKKREGKQASKPPLSLERHLKSPSFRLMEVGETLRLCALGLTHEGGRKPEV